ncbi:hypothetical protein EV426DRAFT_710168 [Tirmania nivea]|nr:hypothetical protein EV426DRAFT_710168 [Tirmania nivea]
MREGKASSNPYTTPKKAEKVDGCLPIKLPSARTSYRLEQEHIRRASIAIFSYADDVNPLIVTEGPSKRQHDEVVMGRSSKTPAQGDKKNEARLDFRAKGGNYNKSIKTLGITIDTHLKFSQHINTRTKKAASLLSVMERLSNSNGGISSKATERSRPPNLQLDAFRRLEYRALRKITGAYFGSSHRKVAWIAGVEALESKTRRPLYMLGSQSCQDRDINIKSELKTNTKGKTSWHDV